MPAFPLTDFFRLPKTVAMQLIKRNKSEIHWLESKIKCYQECAARLWSQCNPDDPVSTETYYKALNNFKDEIRKGKKDLKALSEFQRVLKRSIS